MRVLLTTDTVGGVWTFTKELANGLLQSGNEVMLVSFGRMPSVEQTRWCEVAARTNGRSFRYFPSDVPLEWMEHNEDVFTDSAAVLKEIASSFCPDLLHSSQFCLGALDLRIPRLITAHSDVMSWGKAVKAEALPDSFWLREYRKIVQHGLDGADALVAPTEWMRGALLQHFDVPCRFEVIHNGRTLPALANPGSRHNLQAVTVGRLWDEGKGLHILFEVNPTMPILLAGEESFGNASGVLPSGMVALGSLGESELLDLFRQSSVYVATSMYEPFGLAALEAALCGCAVLSRELTSLREVWGNAAVYFRDAAELEAALLDLAGNATLLKRAQEAAMARALIFTGECMTESYLALYHSLLNDRASSRTVEEVAAHAV